MRITQALQKGGDLHYHIRGCVYHLEFQVFSPQVHHRVFGVGLYRTCSKLIYSQYIWNIFTISLSISQCLQIIFVRLIQRHLDELVSEWNQFFI